MRLNLLTFSSAKLLKARAAGVLNVALHLAPADLSGPDLCPWRTPGCSILCVNVSGHGGIGAGTNDEIRNGTKTNTVQIARIRRSKLFFSDRPQFFRLLSDDIARLDAYAREHGLILAIRLNGTSDIPFHLFPQIIAMMDIHPNVRWYDYTKNPKPQHIPDGYHLTFSLSESNQDAALDVLAVNGTVAVVVRTKALAKSIVERGSYRLGNHDWPVVSGDTNDLRYLDPAGSIVILYAKGRAKADTTGMVRDV